jgi:HPt (histidine-containing phosphotransfer) domain-containing protein
VSDLGTRIESLRLRFIERTSAELGSLQRVLEEIDIRPAEALAQAARMIHAIHGAAATFGFIEVTARAGAVERHLKQRMTAGTQSPQPYPDELLPLLTELEAAVAEAAVRLGARRG